MRINLSGAGFWISPHRKYFLISTHIESVCSAPRKFGIDEKSLRQLFEAHNEPYGSEAEARIEVVRALVRHGWIRVRHYRDGWTVNVGILDGPVRATLAAFFGELYGGALSFEDVRIDHLHGVEKTDVDRVIRYAGRGGEDALPRVARISGPEAIPDSEVVVVQLEP